MTILLTPTEEHVVATRDGLWMSPADAESISAPSTRTARSFRSVARTPGQKPRQPHGAHQVSEPFVPPCRSLQQTLKDIECYMSHVVLLWRLIVADEGPGSQWMVFGERECVEYKTGQKGAR